MPDLFDIRLRALRRDRAARAGSELFLLKRIFDDCMERVQLIDRKFETALLIGSVDPSWPEQLRTVAAAVDVRDPGPAFAAGAGGSVIVEDAWDPSALSYDLVLAVGTLDTVNDLPLALRLIRHAIQPGGLFIGALAGGETLPQLRASMRAADVVTRSAAPHVHPRVEPAALSPLLADAGFVRPVVDVDRLQASYRSLPQLVRDLRGMAATNVLLDRPRALTRAQMEAARRAFADAGDGQRTTETFEILHFAAWAPAKE